jgi:hypothetical protein
MVIEVVVNFEALRNDSRRVNQKENCEASNYFNLFSIIFARDFQLNA